MAKKSLIVKTQRGLEKLSRMREAQKQLLEGGKKEEAKQLQKFSTRAYFRCERCGRPRAYIRKFHLCRICFRELANNGQIPGVTKASW